MPLEPLDEAACLGGGKYLIKRCWFVRVEIVLHERDLRRVWKMRVGQFLENAREVRGGALVRDLDMPPALQRREQHEQIGRAIAPVLIIVSRDMPGLCLDRRARLRDQLFRGL